MTLSADGSVATLPDVSAPGKKSYYSVGALKLIVLSTASLGLYEIVWHYRNWKAHEAITGQRQMAWLRAIFGPFTFFALVSELEQPDPDVPAAGDFSGRRLAIAYLVLNFTWRLPDPWWLVAFLTVVPLAFAQRQIDRYADPALTAARRRFGMGSVLTILAGVILWTLILIGLFLPDPA